MITEKGIENCNLDDLVKELFPKAEALEGVLQALVIRGGRLVDGLLLSPD